MYSFTCAVIGEGNITLSCLRHLKDSGFHVDVVVTNTKDVITYCEGLFIDVFPRRKNLEAVLKDKYFDYLFSVNNPTILSPRLLSFTKKVTINYHDSLLPAYAGVHATSWAIMQGETTHGISWHVVESGIDTGDILQNQSVKIDNSDSALTLNLKCFEACIEAFKRLIHDIMEDCLEPVPQDLKDRSYFGLYKLPPNLGVLCLEQDVKDVFNLARALEFGTHDNQLGSPKICTPSGSFLLVTNADLSSGIGSYGYHADGSRPQTVLDIVNDTVVVATSTGPLSLTLADLDGHPLNSDSLQQYGVNFGVEIPSVSGLDMEVVTQLRKKEPFWRRTMKAYDPTTFFVQKLNVLPEILDGLASQEIITTKIPIPNTTSLEMDNSLDELLLTSFITFLARSCCSSQIHVGLLTSNKCISQAYRRLYSNICPAIFNIDFSCPTDDTINKIIHTIKSHREAGTFLVDMFYRYPELRGIRRFPHHNMVIALETDDAIDNLEVKTLLSESHILVVIGSEDLTVFYTNKHGNSYSRIEDVLRHFPAFLKSLTMQSKSLSLIDVDLISALEKQALYGEPDFHENDESSEDILPLIHDIVRKYSSSVAITSTDLNLSYSDLLDEVNHLTSCLQLYLPEEYRTELKCIALHMTNSVAYVISQLASISANCPFLPLPENLPIHRLAFMIQDVRATVMLTTREIYVSDKFREFQSSPEILFELPSKYGDLVMLFLKVDQLFIPPSQPSSNLPEVYSFTSLSDLAPNDDQEETPLHPDCCYVMYTSGSTGKPKGVQVLRSGVLNMALAQIDEWDLGPGDVIAQFASIGFDASISEIFTALASGATLAVLNEQERLGQEFTNTMTKLEVTTITLPPSVLNIYKPTDFPKLQKVVTAGEPCTLLTAVRWTHNTNIRFFNAYGPTESTVCATIHEFHPKHSEDTLSKELPIGKAIQGVQVYLFDDLMKPVPPNLVGEIFIGGKSLSAGYVGHASSKNEERFLDNPLYPGFKLYKTGDHALQSKDGSLTYIGRMDDQVKIRGQRVDLNEIEQVLLQHSKVEMAIVVKHQSTSNSDPTIAAFIAPTFVFISELREYLSKALPNYMVPSYIKKMSVEDFPLNLNGKIDRKKLERDQTIIKKTPDAGSSHLSDIQLKMAKLWCQVLQLDDSYVYSMHRLSSFSEHGGNSLHMVLLQRAIENEFGVLLSFTDIGSASSIQDFADMMNRKKNSSSEQDKPPKMAKEDLRNFIIQDSIFDPDDMGIINSDPLPETGQRQLYPQNILLSGTTGFLGAYLLYEILEQTEAHVCCMVRESTEVRGFGRVVSNMRKYDLWKTSFNARIAIVLSDISKPAMGIAPDIYKSLSVAVDTVFMNAAKMNFNTDYYDHREANVVGAKELIRFCFAGRRKFLFTTSSLGVFLFPQTILRNGNALPDDINKSEADSDVNGNVEHISNSVHNGVNSWSKANMDEILNKECDNVDNVSKSPKDNIAYTKMNLTKTKSTYIELVSNGASFKTDYQSFNGQCNGILSNEDKRYDTKEIKRVVYGEADEISDPSKLSGGYNQSKWASEQLVLQALEYLPGGAIFRPARVSGHSKTGSGPTNDLFACILKGIDSLKCAPDLDFPFDLTPVDYCARGMIEITTQIIQSDEQKMPQIYHFFNQATLQFLDLFKEMDIKTVSLKEWRTRIEQADRENVLVPFTPFIQSDFWDRSPDWPIFNTDNTTQFISADCKKLLLSSEQLLEVYRRFFNESK